MNHYTVIGDIHITNSNLKINSQLFEIIEELGKPTIFLGDLQDTKEIVRGKSLNLLFTYLKSSKLQHILLVGNHDLFNLESTEHSLEVFKSLPNVTIVDRLTVQDSLAFLPYMHDKELLKVEMENARAQGATTLFAHLDVKSFDYGNGHISENGLELSDLAPFKLVVSGHYHLFQQRGNLMFLGTPFSHTFGEANQDKFLGIFDPEAKSIFLLEMGSLPKHLIFRLNISNPDLSEVLTPIGEQAEKGHFVRVDLSGTAEEHAAFKKDQFNSKIKWVPIILKDEKKYYLAEASSNANQFLTWAKDIKKLDAETIELGNQILGSLNAK